MGLEFKGEVWQEMGILEITDICLVVKTMDVTETGQIKELKWEGWGVRGQVSHWVPAFKA